MSCSYSGGAVLAPYSPLLNKEIHGLSVPGAFSPVSFQAQNTGDYFYR